MLYELKGGQTCKDWGISGNQQFHKGPFDKLLKMLTCSGAINIFTGYLPGQKSASYEKWLLGTACGQPVCLEKNQAVRVSHKARDVSNIPATSANRIISGC